MLAPLGAFLALLFGVFFGFGSKVVVCCVVGCVAWAWLWKEIHRQVFTYVTDRDTGEQRRKSCPPALDLSEKSRFAKGSYESEEIGRYDLKNERGFITLRNGKNIFYQTWVPAVGDVLGIVIVFHGYGDNCDFTAAAKAKILSGLGHFATATFDFPGHGRSDGYLAHIHDWFDFVAEARETVEEHLKVKLLEQFPGRKVFSMAESMGGGVLFTMLVKEKTLFDGAILVCPMIFVSRDMFPPWIVEQIFKYFLVALFPMWPVSPNKDLGDLCFEDPAMRNHMGDHRKINTRPAKPRLQTAWQLAFVAGEWMRNRIPEYDTPTMIVHGGADKVTDHRVSQELFEHMRSEDKEFLYPPGVWHADLFHGGPKHVEGVKERFEAVVRWLKNRC